MVKQPKSWLLSAAAVLALIVMVGLVWANHRYISQASGENSFIPGWLGTRLLLTKGWSPYSSETTAEIQSHPENLPARAGGKPEFFLYPFYASLAFSPFALTGSADGARTAWMTVLELALFATLAASIALSRWRTPAWALILLIIFPLGWYYSLRAVLDGDIVILAALFLALASLAIRAGQDAAAGGFLLLATVKPPAALVFIAAVLLWAAFSRRWTVVWVFLGGLALLTAAASLFSPAWTLDFARQIIRHYRQIDVTSLSSLLAIWVPGISKQLSWIISAAALTLLIFEWRRAFEQDARWFHWTACLTLAVAPLVGLPINLNDYVLMLPSLVLILAVWDERWGVLGRISIVLGLLVLTAGVWWLLFAGLQRSMAPDQNPWLYIVQPIFLIVGLYWVRWWAIRPPRLPMEELAGQLGSQN